MSSPENVIQQAILLDLGARSDLTIWRQNTGVAYDGRRPVRFGIPGQADITGVLAGGRRLELEIKAPGGRVTQEQATFGKVITSKGGLWAVVRSVDEARAVVDAALGVPVGLSGRVNALVQQAYDAGRSGAPMAFTVTDWAAWCRGEVTA